MGVNPTADNAPSQSNNTVSSWNTSRSSSSGVLQGFSFLTEEMGKKQKGTGVQEGGAVSGVIPARLAVQPSAHGSGVSLGAV